MSETQTAEGLPPTPEEKKAQRLERAAVKRKERLDSFNVGFSWKVVRRVDIDKVPAGSNQPVMQTPMGNKGRRGWLLEEATGKDTSGIAHVHQDGSIFVGADLIEIMREVYGNVEGPASLAEAVEVAAGASTP